METLTLQYLLGLYAGVILINLAISTALWVKGKSELYYDLFLLWLNNLILFIVSGILQQNYFLMILAHATSFPLNYIQARLVAKTIDYKIPFKKWTFLVGFSWIVFFFVSSKGGSFTAQAIPITLAITLPMIMVAIKALFFSDRKLSFIQKTFTFTILLNGLHWLDFPFLRDKPEMALFGFTTALILLSAIAVLAPAMIIAQFHKELQLKAEEEKRGIAKFPEECPYPILRISNSGILLYANRASHAILALWGAEIGKDLRSDWKSSLLSSIGSKLGYELNAGGKIFSLDCIPIEGASYFNVYGHDITARKEAEQVVLRHKEELADSFRVLQQETQKVSCLLDNMKQAVFSVTKDAIIDTPVSKYAETIFDGQIPGKSIFDILYRDIDSSSETFSYLKTTLMIVYGENELQYELLCENLPTNIAISRKDQVLKVNYAPIWNSSGNLEKLLFIVEDITELLKIEKAMNSENEIITKDMQIVKEMISNDIDEIKDFLLESSTRLENCSNFGKSVAEKTDQELNIFRDLHSLKGIARIKGLKLLSGSIHKAEGDIKVVWDEVKHEKASNKGKQEKIGLVLNEIKTTLSDYMNVLHKFYKLGDNLERTDGDFKVEVPVQNLQRLKNAISKINKNSGNPVFENIKDAFNRLLEQPLVTEVSKLGNWVKEISSNLGKEVRFDVKGDYVSLDRKTLSLLYEVLVHVIRNAIDHGVESPVERTKLGKPADGNILLQCKEDENNILVYVKDDGKGIDLDRVCRLAVERKIKSEAEIRSMTEQEKIELIFLPNFSTKDEIDEISGRGIGANVSKENVKKLGGAIFVKTQINRGTEFEIRIPKPKIHNHHELNEIVIE